MKQVTPSQLRTWRNAIGDALTEQLSPHVRDQLKQVDREMASVLGMRHAEQTRSPRREIQGSKPRFVTY